ncbi:hypothetical protein PYW07_013530 [Mythimna separata]|uniref:FP protein C-terminal domain-containing protein n=1 Tax=Mythimna separata TaxID=271217 RepID=A0AAD8DMJ6_MYTSE|nr:hypothetical protein PYW07_013530 [Mythimna separata]
MTLNRTPPTSPKPQPKVSVDRADNTASTSVRFTPHESTLQQCASAPDLSSEPDTDCNAYKKRKFDGDSATASTGLTRAMFDTFSNKQKAQFDDLMLRINSIIEQNIDLKQSVEVMSAKYDEFLSRISYLEAEKKADNKLIQQMEDKIEHLQRNMKASEIEIRNVPKSEGETKDDLCDLVVNLSQTLNINISEANLRDIQRVKSKGNSNAIIVTFSSVIIKDRVIKGVKMFNKSKDKGNKLNTTHLKLKNNQPVYVSERLTLKTQKLNYLARTQHKNYGYNFCWTSYGVVYLRKKTGDPQIRINSAENFLKLKPANCA